MLANSSSDRTKEGVLLWAKSTKEAAVKENADFLAKLPGQHHLVAWHGYTLSKNDYIISLMDDIIAYFERDEVADADIQVGLQIYQDAVIADHIRYTGEGSQNPGHALKAHGEACARAELLSRGYLQFMPLRPGK